MDGLRFVLYDKANVFRRSLSGLNAEADLVVNGICTATFTVDDDALALAEITADGARCGVWFGGVEQFRGRIKQTPGVGPGGTVSATVEDDLRKLWDWLGWPVPGAALTAQAAEYRTYAGAPETVFKTALQENLTRLGVPWTVATDLGRGAGTAAVNFRFHPLADKLIPVLEQGGLVVTLDHSGSGVVVDVRVPALVVGKLTTATGVPDGYDFNRTAPSVTRAIVGGRGEGVAREFVSVVDAARETAWGDIIEAFVDARNTDVGSDITVDGVDRLAEGAARVAVSTDLVETARFRFMSTYQLGDLVDVSLGPVESIEQVRGVSITESVEDGVVVVPRIGDLDVSADVDVQLARDVARLARGVRDQGRR